MWGLCMLACQRLEVQAGQLSGCNNSGGLAGCQGGQPRQHFCFHTALRSSRLLRTQRCTSGVRTSALRQRTHRRGTVGTYPVPETEKERSPVDYPQEWITPQPSRRPDTQPEFEKLETPLPKKMPGDPEQPDEEEAEEEEKKKKKEEDPDKEGEKEGEPEKEKSPLPDKE